MEEEKGEEEMSTTFNGEAVRLFRVGINGRPVILTHRGLMVRYSKDEGRVDEGCPPSRKRRNAYPK